MKGVLVDEAAQRIGIPRGQVQRLVRTGDIRVMERIGTLLLLEPSDVQREADRYARLRDWVAGVERM